MSKLVTMTKMKGMPKKKRPSHDSKVQMSPSKEDNDWEVLSTKLSRMFRINYLVKLVIVELIVYLILYYAINMIYRFALDDDQQQRFARLVKFFHQSLGSFSRDITFLLGFYVSIVAKRWWDQYRLLPWPDNLALTLSGFVMTDAKASQDLRQAIVRYAMLAYVLCIRRFSTNLQRHLPTLQSIQDLGLLKEDEKKKLGSGHDYELSSSSSRDDEEEEEPEALLESNWWLPLTWAASLIKFGKLHGHLPSDGKDVMGQIMRFRSALEAVESHVHVSIPLVYKLVVKSAIYLYFSFTLIGSQTIGLDGEQYDMYFPLFTVFKLVLFIGWLKVAQSIERPFGEDDADFQMNSLLTRHIRTTSIMLNEFDNVPSPFEANFYPPKKEDDEDKRAASQAPLASKDPDSGSSSEDEVNGGSDRLRKRHSPTSFDSSNLTIVDDYLESNGKLTSAKINRILPDNSVAPGPRDTSV